MCWRPSPTMVDGALVAALLVTPCRAQVPPPADARHRPQPRHDKPRLRPTDNALTADEDVVVHVVEDVDANADAAVACRQPALVCG